MFGRRSARRAAGIALALLVSAPACAGSDPAVTSDGTGLRVVVTTTILGDIVGDVVGDAGAVEVLLERGRDPHDVALSAQQAQSIRSADLVVANGLGLEAALVDTLASAEEDGVRVLRVAPLLDPRPAEAASAEHDDEHDEHDEGGLDPHVWLDPVRMADGARRIGEVLAELDETGDAAAWRDRADAVADAILDTHDQVVSILAEVPPACRVLVTNHDGFGYFAERYGLEVVGTIIPGTSSQAEASARDVAELADLIRERGVPAIFVEDVESQRLADVLAGEVGGTVEVVELFAGSLGDPGSGAETYVELLLTDATRIADALRSCT